MIDRQARINSIASTIVRFLGSGLTVEDAAIAIYTSFEELGCLTPDQPAAPCVPCKGTGWDVDTHNLSSGMCETCKGTGAAPDEDAAVRELIHAFWIEGGTVHKDIAIAYAKRILSAGYTRRPVDTRPTVSQLSELKYAADGHNGPIWSFTVAQIDCLVEHGYAIPDPAPAAEDELVDPGLRNAVFAAWNDVIFKDSPARCLTDPEIQLREEFTVYLANELAALTRATDR